MEIDDSHLDYQVNSKATTQRKCFITLIIQEIKETGTQKSIK